MWWLGVLNQNRAFCVVALVVAVVAVLLCVVHDKTPNKLTAAMERLQMQVLREYRPAPGNATSGSGEERCRRFLQRMSGLQFKRVRPSWLRNPRTGRALELDMFVADPRPVAFEFDGAQHDRYTPFYHGTVQEFEDAQERDRVKDELCRQAGVELIRIPSAVHDQPEAFVYEHLLRLGLVTRVPGAGQPPPQLPRPRPV